jgi:CubicO group peptidase (beta-lactamase class C family)
MRPAVVGIVRAKAVAAFGALAALAALATLGCAARPPAPGSVAPVTPTAHAAGPSSDPRHRERLLALVPHVDALLAERTARAGVPGAVFGLVVDGDLVWWKGYGARDLGTKQPVDADTVFRIASVTKSFTAAALLQLRDAGRVSLDDAAERYVPELASLVYPTRDARRITLRELLTHTAGLPHDSPPAEGLDFPSEEGILEALRGMRLDAPPDERYSYSNLGYDLAGMVVSRASGVPYRDWVDERLLRPLGMTSTGFDPSRLPDALATGYVRDGDGLRHPPLLRPRGMDPAGGLFSSLRDLARWASFQLSAWPARDDPELGPLRRSSVREAHGAAAWRRLDVFPRIVGRDRRVNATAYGLGWIVEDTCEWDRVVWHNGNLSDGYHSTVFLLPDRGTGIVALANVDDVARGDVDRMVREAMRLLEGPAQAPPAPALVGAQELLLSLRAHWDDAVGERAFAARGGFLGEIHEGLADDVKQHGACRPTSARTLGHDRLRWEMACDRGGQTYEITVRPTDGRITQLRREHTMPADARLLAAARHLAALVARWSDEVYDATVEPSIERVRMRAAFAQATAEHASCEVDHVEDGADARHARFVLKCAYGGPLDLWLTLDRAGRRVEDVLLTAPVEPGQKCP